MEGMMTAGAATKAALGAITGFSVLHLSRRLPIAQRMRIRNNLRAQALGLRQRGAPFISPFGPFPRTSELRVLRDVMSSPPGGPLVVTGAEGVGTSALVLQALTDISPPFLLYVNMREQARSAHRPFLWQFVQASGFYTMPREWAELGMGRSARGGMDTFDEHDMDSCLATMATVLTQQKAARDKAVAGARWWGGSARGRNPPLPVICLDELHNVESGGENFSMHAPLRKFLQWALFLTDAQLAHVILIARPHVASALDQMSPFRAHRRRIVVGFAPEEEVVRYLGSADGGAFAAEEAQQVASLLGGQLKDLRQIVQAAQREQGPWQATMAELLADSEDIVARHWEGLVDAGNATSLSRSARIGAYKRSARFWALAETIASKGSVRRGELVSSTFSPTGGSAAAELEGYIEAGLLTYCPPPESSPGQEEAGSARDALWVGAASPRLRAALAALVADPLHAAHRDKAAGELAKHEQVQRMEQLAQRRAEVAAELTALGAVARTSLADGDEALQQRLREAAAAAAIEQRCTAAELRAVRCQYDEMKWKGRWSKLVTQ